VATFALCLAMPGCELLPSDGPSANNVVGNAAVNKKADPKAVMRFALVGIDARVTQDAEQFYQPVPPPVPREFEGQGSFGRVGVGDVLKVTIWEAAETGVFGGRGKGAEMAVRVESNGTIGLPYAGRFRVAGKSPSQIEDDIVAGLKDKAVQPQATVIVADNVSSIVSVQGDVAKSGPQPMAKNERVLDMIAMAGGAKYPPFETMVRLTRRRSTMAVSLQDVIDRPENYNVPLAAGDALLLTRAQQKFLAFGAIAKPGEQIFSKTPLNLSDALGVAFGLDAQRSDAMAVYLFRREPIDLAARYGVPPLPEDQVTVPIVYQLNLRDPKSFFAMNRFPVRPGDILYVSTAPLAEAARFFQILSGATATVAIPRTLGGNYPTGQ